MSKKKNLSYDISLYEKGYPITEISRMTGNSEQLIYGHVKREGKLLSRSERHRIIWKRRWQERIEYVPPKPEEIAHAAFNKCMRA